MNLEELLAKQKKTPEEMAAYKLVADCAIELVRISEKGNKAETNEAVLKLKESLKNHNLKLPDKDSLEYKLLTEEVEKIMGKTGIILEEPADS